MIIPRSFFYSVKKDIVSQYYIRNIMQLTNHLYETFSFYRSLIMLAYVNSAHACRIIMDTAALSLIRLTNNIILTKSVSGHAPAVATPSKLTYHPIITTLTICFFHSSICKQ